MALEHQTFVGVLRQSYPDECRRVDNGTAPAQEWGWEGARYLRGTPEDRRAAMAGALMDPETWSHMDTDDRAELVRLAGEQSPLAEVYTFADFRLNQTRMYDSATGRSTKYGVEMSWSPLTDDGIPAQGSPQWQAANDRLAGHVNAADLRASRRAEREPAPRPPAEPVNEDAINRIESRNPARAERFVAAGAELLGEESRGRHEARLRSGMPAPLVAVMLRTSLRDEGKQTQLDDLLRRQYPEAVPTPLADAVNRFTDVGRRLPTAGAETGDGAKETTGGAAQQVRNRPDLTR